MAAKNSPQNFKNFKTFKQRILIYLLFFLAGSLFRFWLISNNNVLFWYDQARDAIIVHQMIEEKDIKIQGPSASGTSDTVYHGVLYYYVIAPLYALGNGNPQVVSGILGILSMLALLPLGELSWQLFRSRRAFLLTLLFFTFSVDAAQMGTWLSNPMLALITIPAFYYFLYRVFWLKQPAELWLLVLFLGLSNQAVIYTLYLFGVVAMAWLLARHLGQTPVFRTQQLFAAALVYILTTASMMLTQVMLLVRGIFHPLAVFDQLNSTMSSASEEVIAIVSNYLDIIGYTYFPTKPILSVVIFIFTLWFVYKKLPRQTRLFFSLVLLSPLFLISWQARGSYHIFIGLAPLLTVFSAGMLKQIQGKQRLSAVLVLALMALFLLTNIEQLRFSNQTGQHPVAIQTGTTMKEKLQLIDSTYIQAAGQPFTISSLVSPYNYNTTWAYLYHWYGQEKYGYTPAFFGPDQAGIYGGDLLEMASKPAQVHFALYEPTQGIPVWLVKEFTEKQARFSVVVEKTTFGSMTVERRGQEEEPVQEVF